MELFTLSSLHVLRTVSYFHLLVHLRLETTLEILNNRITSVRVKTLQTVRRKLGHGDVKYGIAILFSSCTRESTGSSARVMVTSGAMLDLIGSRFFASQITNSVEDPINGTKREATSDVFVLQAE
jgi:hypothetical protein